MAQHTTQTNTGAALSKRGRPIIALPATAKAPVSDKTDTSNGMLAPVNGEISRIVPILATGAAVTTSRAHVHYVVTEYGVAALHGRTLAERTHSLIEIAAPQFREALERAAYDLHLIR
jgi:4-hydroxybutyrate CoA-transferase